MIAIQQARKYSEIFKIVFILRVRFKYFLILEQWFPRWLPNMPNVKQFNIFNTYAFYWFILSNKDS